jgi:hypothetical protein
MSKNVNIFLYELATDDLVPVNNHFTFVECFFTI